MDAAGLDLACREIARVLKPRGIAVAAGKSRMAACARAFKAAGLSVEGPKSCSLQAFTAMAMVVARKP